MENFKLNIGWLSLISLAGILSIMFLYFTIFPGEIPQEALKYFAEESILLGREYAQSVRILFIVAFIVKISFILWFLLSGRASALANYALNLSREHYYLSIIIFFTIFWVILELINLPFRFYGSFIFQHKWGFSTQTFTSWWLDYFKEGSLSFLLSLVGVMTLFFLMNTWPKIWWIQVSILLSIWLLIQTFLWPVLIAPLFNKFEPLRDSDIEEIVDDLSEKADLPIKEILIMDASSRTKAANAYFAGIGSSKRIVLYDNLLEEYQIDEIEAVLAHEIAHWKKGHIIKGIILGIIGIFIAWGILSILLKLSFSSMAIRTKFPLESWILIICFFLLMTFITMPIENTISKKMEREADTLAVQLTNNKEAAIKLQKHLALNNFADVLPPAFIEWFFYSHPSTVKRIHLIENSL